jgi:hypothetical protein
VTRAGWWGVEAAAILLEPRERELVLGDIAETDGPAGRGIAEVLGLAVRRQLLLWKSWRPWLAAFGWALPASFMLMGLSVSVSWGFLHAAAGLAVGSGAGLAGLLGRVCLLLGWSWSGGFVAASMARRTLWVTIAAACVPCLYCLSLFRDEALSPVCLVLFVLPAFWGLLCGLRGVRLRPVLAVMFAVGVTALTLQAWLGSTHSGLPVSEIALLWPVWYLAAARARPNT